MLARARKISGTVVEKRRKGSFASSLENSMLSRTHTRGGLGGVPNRTPRTRRRVCRNPEQGIRDYVRVEDQLPPDPSTLGPRDVLVGIRSSAVSWVDVLMTSGQYQHIPTLPYTPGLEYSGEVLWAGAEASQFDKGAEVYVGCFSTGPRSSGPYQAYGGFASYAVAPVDAVALKPENFSFDQACNFAGNFETAYHCVVDCADLKRGETILIHGASGRPGLQRCRLQRFWVRLSLPLGEVRPN